MMTEESKCEGCAEKAPSKTFGIIDFAKAKLSGKVVEHVRAMREGICERCNEAVTGDNDRNGERLFRKIDGVPYCGKPHKLIERRDNKAFGCGCDLSDKVLWNKSKCPREHWGPNNKFGTQFMPFVYEVDAAPEKTLNDVVDFYLPSSGDHADMTGIGDTILLGPIVQAYAKKMAADGYRVRFCVPWGRIAWARFAAPTVEIDDLSNADRDFGVMGYHSSDFRFFELDETARQMGTTRAGYIAKRFDIDLDAAMRDYVVDIPQESTTKFANDAKMNQARKNGQPIIGIAPFSHNPLRTWPIRHWVHLVYILREVFKAMVVVIDGGGDSKRTECFPCTRWVGLEPHDTAALMRRFDVMIGNDSGMSHMGGFLKVPTLVVCGITDGKIIYDSYPSVTAVQSRKSCTGCLWFKENGYKPWCMKGCDAINELKPEWVAEQVGLSLAEKQSATA